MRGAPSEEFNDARAEDFRVPLYNNLQQVFAGALKTAPAEEKESATRVAKAKPVGRGKSRKSA